MCAPSPPPSPDYTGAAQQQGAANLTAAQQGSVISNPNIVSPYGNQTVTWAAPDPNLPGGAQQATVTQSLTPDAQAALSAQQHTQAALGGLAQQGIGQAQNILGTPFQYQGPALQTALPSAGGVDYGPSAGQYGLAAGVNARAYGLAQSRPDLAGVAAMPINAGTTAQQAIMARLQPQIDQQSNATAQRLANQGIRPGSEAYDNEMRTQQQGQNDLRSQAALQGINLDMSANQQGYGQALSNAGLYNQAIGQNFSQGLGAQQLTNQAIGQNFGQGATSAGLYNQAQNQQFNQQLQAAQFANNAQQASLQQQLGLYNQPLNQITALMAGSQIQNPQFQAFTGQNVNAAPVFQGAQAQGQYNQDIYAQQVAASNALVGGLAGIGAGFATHSDERLKSNIVRVGDHPLGIGVYEYDIFGQRQRGVMAQDVLRVKPEAVSQDKHGWLMVDYGAL